MLDPFQQLKLTPVYLKYHKFNNPDLVLSPYFDFETQQIIDPFHLEELIAQIDQTMILPVFEKEIIVELLRRQGGHEEITADVLAELVKLVTKSEKKVELPEF